jgi:osmotically-inducible protein OsmY
MTRALLTAGKVSLLGAAVLFLSSPALRAQGTSTAGRTSSGSGGSMSGGSGSTSGSPFATGSSATGTGSSPFQAAGVKSQIAGTGATGRTGANQTNGPTQGNPFLSTYAYPQQAGMSSTTTGRGGSSGSFGQQLYYASVSGGSNSNTTATTANTAKVPSNYNSFGMKRDLPYQTVMGPTVGGAKSKFNPSPAQLQGALQDSITQSQRISANRNVRVSIEGEVVVLQGYVDTPRDSRIAEGLMRSTPGVRDVRNELQVKNPENP